MCATDSAIWATRFCTGFAIVLFVRKYSPQRHREHGGMNFRLIEKMLQIFLMLFRHTFFRSSLCSHIVSAVYFLAASCFSIPQTSARSFGCAALAVAMI